MHTGTIDSSRVIVIQYDYQRHCALMKWNIHFQPTLPTPNPASCNVNPCLNGVCTALRNGFHCNCRPGKGIIVMSYIVSVSNIITITVHVGLLMLECE